MNVLSIIMVSCALNGSLRFCDMCGVEFSRAAVFTFQIETSSWLVECSSCKKGGTRSHCSLCGVMFGPLAFETQVRCFYHDYYAIFASLLSHVFRSCRSPIACTRIRPLHPILVIYSKWGIYFMLSKRDGTTY